MSEAVRQRRARVVMMGPSRAVRGGITAVVNSLLDAMPDDSGGVRYVATHVDGPKVLKALAAVGGTIALLWLVLTWRPDIVHVHTASSASYRRKSFLAALARRLGCAVVVHVHGGGFHEFHDSLTRAGQDHIRSTLESADLVIALTDIWKERLAGMAPGADIRVLMNPVAAGEYAATISGRPPIPADGGTLMFLGAFQESKGIFDLIEAAALVARQRPGIVLELGGDREVDEVRDLAAKRGLAENVRLLGWVRGAEKLDTFRRAHLFVLPSYREGLPVAMLEAMAAGLPIITTPVGGIPQVIEDGVHGMLVEPGDIEGMSTAILRLLDDEEARSRVADANAEAAMRNHDATALARKLSLWYDEIVARRTRAN